MNTVTQIQSQDKFTVSPSASPNNSDRFAQALELWNKRLRELNSQPDDATVEQENAASDLWNAAEEQLFAIPVETIADLRVIAEVLWPDPNCIPRAERLAVLFAGICKLDKGGRSRTFDPSAWLAWYERAGGGWHESEGVVTLLTPAHRSENLNDALWELDTRDGLAAVREEIRQRIMRAEEPKPTWGKLLSDFQNADARLAEHGKTVDNSTCGSPENIAYEAKTEKLVDEHTEALEALFRHPSPDYAAFAYKLSLYDSNEVYTYYVAGEFAKIVAEEAKRFAA